MDRTLEEIESELLELPENVRAQLAERLLHSLEGAGDPEVEEIWVEEAIRRREDLRRNPAGGRLTIRSVWRPWRSSVANE